MEVSHLDREDSPHGRGTRNTMKHSEESGHQNETRTSDDIPTVFCALFPFVTLLRLAGAIYIRGDSHYKARRRVSKIEERLGFVYCFFTFTVNWLSFFR